MDGASPSRKESMVVSLASSAFWADGAIVVLAAEFKIRHSQLEAANKQRIPMAHCHAALGCFAKFRIAQFRVWDS
jgi:hypothetical protein